MTVVTVHRPKAEMLGGGTVTLHTPQAGSSRPRPLRNGA